MAALTTEVKKTTTSHNPSVPRPRKGYKAASVRMVDPLEHWQDPLAGYIYLITTSENPLVYKVGKTARSPQLRYEGYRTALPGTEIQIFEHCAVAVRRMDIVERICIHELGKQFKRQVKSDVKTGVDQCDGLEWFVGNEERIVDLVMSVCREYAACTNIGILPGFEKKPYRWYDFYSAYMNTGYRVAPRTQAAMDDAYMLYVGIASSIAEAKKLSKLAYESICTYERFRWYFNTLSTREYVIKFESQ